MSYTFFGSDLGTILLCGENGRLRRLDVVPEGKAEVERLIASEFPEAKKSQEPFRKLIGLLKRYVAGERVDFDVPLDLSGLAGFTERVLLEIQKIPYGRLASYGQIGRRLGYLNAAQAVGQALKRNPIPIIIPCHRVIRSDGSLGGFDLGPDIKEKLLSLEGVRLHSLGESMVQW